MSAEHTPPHIGAARDQAITNIYRQLADMQFTSPDDALDAANAIARLGDAEAMWQDSVVYCEHAD